MQAHDRPSSPRAQSLLLALLVGLAGGIMPACAGRAPPRVVHDPLLTGMTLEERAGQLLFLHTLTRDAAPGTERYARISRYVRELGIGGVVLSLGTVAEADALARALDKEARVPLCFAGDFEAGVAFRLTGATRFPYPVAFGATGLPRLARAAGRVTALEARELGVGWSYSPVADVNVNPDNPIINMRSFGERADDVARFVTATVEGMEGAGLASCLKHFPGHGNVTLDSHRTLPRVPAALADWERVEALPFAAGIAAGASSVMTGHLAFPAIEDDATPATLSPRLLSGLLRERLGFDGLIVSDALDMGAITERRTVEEASVEALRAGCDVLLMPRDPVALRDAVARAVREGRVSEARLDDAVLRVLELKRKLGLFRTRVSARPATRFALVGSPPHVALAREVARRCLCLVRDEDYALPLTAAGLGDEPLLLTVLDRASAGRGEALRRAIGERAPALAQVVLHPGSSAEELRMAERRARKASYRILALQIRVRSYSGRIGVSDDLLPTVARVARLSDTVVVALGNPYLLRSLPGTRCYVAAWDEEEILEQAIGAALFGEETIDGRMPVTIPGEAAHGAGLTRGGRLAQLRRRAPESEGLDPKLAERLRARAELAIRERVFPGCRILVARRSSIVADLTIGRETYEPDARPIGREHRFDLASLTKCVATTGLAMALHAKGQLDLDAKVASFLQTFRGGKRDRVTLRQLLTHSAGFVPSLRLDKIATSREEAIAALVGLEPETEPGERTRYSDVGIMLLALCLERLEGQRFDELCDELVFSPLGMHATRFGPLPDLVPVAPTEVVPARGGLLRGSVHDENAERLGGVAGHAGLFSTADDLLRFCRAVLCGLAPFSPRTAELFTKRAGLVEGSSRALGFDTYGEGLFGHTGFTGTSFIVDTRNDLILIALTNRVHPTRKGKGIRAFRAALRDILRESLDD